MSIQTDPVSIAGISPTELDKLMKEGRRVELIDVRTPAEYRELHAAPARLVAPA